MKRADSAGNSLYESTKYEMNFRGTSSDLSTVKIYTNRNSYQVDRQISFDSEYVPVSSLEYFAGSVLSSILLALLEQSKRRGSVIEEIEGVLSLSLENPLTLLGVRGYDEEPFISRMAVTVYLYADLEDAELDEFCRRALAGSPVYNTLTRSMQLEVLFRRLT